MLASLRKTCVHGDVAGRLAVVAAGLDPQSVSDHRRNQDHMDGPSPAMGRLRLLFGLAQHLLRVARDAISRLGRWDHANRQSMACLVMGRP